jgi:hypothetical protein
MPIRLSTVASARRLANQWVDLSKPKRRPLLDELDVTLRIAVIEHMARIRLKRRARKIKE